MKPLGLVALGWLLCVGPNVPAALVNGTDPYWVFFNDKALTTEADYQAGYAALTASYAPAAIERRELRGTTGSVFTYADLPVANTYVQDVLQTGVTLRQSSSWLNAISINASADQLAALSSLPFVSKVQPVATFSQPQFTDSAPIVNAPQDTATFYGIADSQLNQIHIPEVHNLGYTGAGVTVGILDTGFVRTHQAFNYAGHPLNVLGEYDFVEHDNNTASANGQEAHGTYILGEIGGYYPNSFVGGAYDASFLLAKTEDIFGEYPGEEDNWVAGLQWLEANGADLVTSSLGYIDWYTQAQLNGNTAVTTIAADAAAATGLAIINAAGNSGHDSNPATSHLIAPADGDLVITVGAVDVRGNIAGFSSDGPTADGRLKPEVMAQGVTTATVDPYNDANYGGHDGTSLATPLVASAVALIMQAHPTWTVPQIRLALFSTASQATTPDPLFVSGYGIINTLAAIEFEQPNTVPEPSVILLALAGAWLILRRWRR